MYFFLLFLIALAFLYCNPKIELNLQPGGAYVSRERTMLINGIFTCLVFIFHSSRGYGIHMTEAEYGLLKCLVRGQMIVSTFLFFSGFGIMTSLLKKGPNYAAGLICKRFPKLWLHFAVAVLCFLCVNVFLLNHTPTWQKTVLALLSFETIGNSNWFITVTLFSYLAIGISFLLCRKSPLAGIAATTALLAALAATAHLADLHNKQLYTETTFCMPAGMLFCLYRNRTEAFLSRIKIPTLLLGICCLVFALLWYKYFGNAWLRNVCSIAYAFGFMLTIGCMKLQRLNPVLVWLGGSGLFYFYIFQRIPMAVLNKLGLSAACPPLYLCACFLLTAAIAYAAIPAFRIVDALLFHDKK